MKSHTSLCSYEYTCTTCWFQLIIDHTSLIHNKKKNFSSLNISSWYNIYQGWFIYPLRIYCFYISPSPRGWSHFAFKSVLCMHNYGLKCIWMCGMCTSDLNFALACVYKFWGSLQIWRVLDLIKWIFPNSHRSLNQSQFLHPVQIKITLFLIFWEYFVIWAVW